MGLADGKPPPRPKRGPSAGDRFAGWVMALGYLAIALAYCAVAGVVIGTVMRIHGI